MIDEDDERKKNSTNEWEYLFITEVKSNKMLKYLESIRKRYLNYLISTRREVKKRGKLVKEVETSWLKKVSKVVSGATRFHIINSKTF